MLGVAMLLTAATVGVDYGWEPLPGGGFEYIIQLEPQSLDALRDGVPISSVIPPNFQNIRSFRVVVGRGPVPRIGNPAEVAEAPLSNRGGLPTPADRYGTTPNNSGLLNLPPPPALDDYSPVPQLPQNSPLNGLGPSRSTGNDPPARYPDWRTNNTASNLNNGLGGNGFTNSGTNNNGLNSNGLNNSGLNNNGLNNNGFNNNNNGLNNNGFNNNGLNNSGLPGLNDRGPLGDRFPNNNGLSNPNDPRLNQPSTFSSDPRTNPIANAPPQVPSSNPQGMDGSFANRSLPGPDFLATEKPALPAGMTTADEQQKPWMPFTATLFGLFMSLGGNAYLGLLAWSFRERCQALLRIRNYGSGRSSLYSSTSSYLDDDEPYSADSSSYSDLLRRRTESHGSASSYDEEDQDVRAIDDD